MRNLVGNWAFSGGYVAETGAWATPRSGVDVNFNSDNAADRTYINTSGAANVGPGTTALLNSAGRTVAYLATNPNARYIAVGPGGTVNGGRNTLRLPGINNFDVAFSKRINATAASQNLLLPQNALFNRPDLAFQSIARTIQMVARFQF